MKSVEECIAIAMDCGDMEIVSYLPYILQDFWEIGSDPQQIIDIIKQQHTAPHKLKVLDLCCGKGAVSINIAKHLQCECYGIDAIPEFIAYSIAKAHELGVHHLCKFETADVRERVAYLGQYDVIILGAIGQVFGNYYETLSLIKNILSPGGTIIIDDGYIADESNFEHEQLLRKSELLKQIHDANMQLIDEFVVDTNNDLAPNYNEEYTLLAQRCDELCEKFPHKAELFIDYKNQQRNEYNNMQNEIICSTMLVKLANNSTIYRPKE